MRQNKKATAYVRPGRFFTIKNEMNVPGSVVQIGEVWYRIGHSGTWYRASQPEIDREVGLRAAAFRGTRIA